MNAAAESNSLQVSPLRPAELSVSSTLPTGVIGLVSIGPSMLIVRAFGVPCEEIP